MTPTPSTTESHTLSRRELLKATLIGGGLALSGFSLLQWLRGPLLTASTFIGKAHDYQGSLATLIRDGLRELGLTPAMVNGKRILLKPNLVEPHPSAPHINTHPLVVRGAIEAFLSLGAASVAVAEGPGHRHDTLLVLEESGLGDVLYEDRIPFHDVNMMEGITVPNLGRQTRLTHINLSTNHQRRGLDRLDGKDENTSLGWCHLIDEKFLWDDARHLLRVAQKMCFTRKAYPNPSWILTRPSNHISPSLTELRAWKAMAPSWALRCMPA